MQYNFSLSLISLFTTTNMNPLTDWLSKTHKIGLGITFRRLGVRRPDFIQWNDLFDFLEWVTPIFYHFRDLRASHPGEWLGNRFRGFWMIRPVFVQWNDLFSQICRPLPISIALRDHRADDRGMISFRDLGVSRPDFIEGIDHFAQIGHLRSI